MRSIHVCFVVAVLLVACSKPAALTPPLYAELPAGPGDAEAAPNGRLPLDTHPLRYALELEVVPERTDYRGRVRIDVALDRPRESIYLHAKGLRVSDVRVVRPSAEVLTGTLDSVDDSGLAAVRLTQPVGPGVVRLELDFEASFGTHLAGLYRVEVAGQAYAFTQHEAISARESFPCFDEPRFKTPFEVTLRVPQQHVAIANTRELESQPLADGMRAVRFATTEKLPTYLVAFAVGPLDVVEAPSLPATSVRARALPLRGIAVRGRGEELALALRETPRILESLERYFGIAYPYDKLDLIAVPDFAAGAMENAGAITFRDTYLLMRDDAPEGQRRGFAFVTAHELAHQWFGNLVTMPWWDDTWLNEAFATWMGTRVMAEVYPSYDAWLGALAYTHHAMDVDSQANARQIRQPIRTDHDIDNAFDAITYSKGGAVLSMFERYLGEDTFRAGLRLYMERHRFGSATARDLTSALAEAAHSPGVSAAFFSFLDQPGVPVIEARVDCAASPMALVLRQECYLPLGSEASREGLWQIPVCVRVDAKPEPRDVCTLLSEREARLPIESEACPTWLMPNAGAQSYYRWSLPKELLASLVAHRAELSAAERMSVVANVFAAMRAGTLEPTSALDALAALADARERLVLESVLKAYVVVNDALLDDATRPGLRAEVARLVTPVYAELGLFSPQPREGETKLLRELVVRALGLFARDPALSSELAKLGRTELGLDTDPRAAELPPELIELALQAAVHEGGQAVIDKAIASFAASTDGLARARLLGAVAANRDPALSERVLSLSLDERLRTNERLVPIMAQAGQPETREAAFAWLQKNLDALIAKLSDHGAAAVMNAASGFCSEEALSRVRETFGPQLERMRGGPRVLERTLESIHLCASLAGAQAEETRAYYRAKLPAVTPARAPTAARTSPRTPAPSPR